MVACDRCKCDGCGRVLAMRSCEICHLRPERKTLATAAHAIRWIIRRWLITTTWQPGNPDYLVRGYQSAVTQAWVGSLINILGEFAPDSTRKLKKHKK
jgi:hypothetical protein